MIEILKNKSAVASVEAALLLLPFILFVAVIIESCILAYQVMLIDHSVDAGAKYAATFKGEVKSEFSQYLKDIQETKLGFAEDFTVSVEFCDDVKALSNNKCGTDETDKSKIAVFNLQYEIKPLFLLSRLSIDSEFIKAKSVMYIE